MTLPKTVRGWVQLAAAVVGLLVTLGSVAFAVDARYAHRTEVVALEQHTVASIKTLRCDILDQRISELIAKREAEGLSPRERARLENLMREWEQACSDG